MQIILLIEDHIEMLENLAEYLGMEGYEIIAANTGKKGVALAKQFIPDLIICDILMPGMDGYEVLRLLSDTITTYKIPFIFSTSLSEESDRAKGLKHGADDIIIKPFDFEQLLQKVSANTKSNNKKECLYI